MRRISEILNALEKMVDDLYEVGNDDAQYYEEIIESFNPLFNHVEQIKKFELLPKEWSVEGGELTPKLSLKRKVVMEKYKSEIEKIYA